jgi:methylated-DNA-[protein]-cysteine S-methyltransferase
MKTIFAGNTGPTALGDIWLAVSENGLVAVEYPAVQPEFVAYLEKRYGGEIEFAPEKVEDAIEQLREYANGKRQEFTMPIDWSVLNAFQQRALKITFAIPYGQTRTYKEIAMELGNPHAARAVGRAQATNPMPIVLPCHRVVGSDGKLHGYGGGEGLSTKAWLLKLEKAIIA